MNDVVRTRTQGRLLVLTLNRPQARNAVNGELARGLEAAVDRLESDDELWAGVLTGEGTVFSAGADLKAVAAGEQTELRTERGGFAGFVQRERTKPLIAAVQGDAVAGGMEIAIACDLIIAGAGTRMGLPEASRSLLATGGGLVRLPKLIGEKAAFELAMTGDPQPVEHLATLGLVSRVVPAEEVEQRAVELAERICENAPLAVRAARQVVLGGSDLDEEARWRFADQELARIAETNDFAEGPRAFVEKRPPRWTAT